YAVYDHRSFVVTGALTLSGHVRSLQSSSLPAAEAERWAGVQFVRSTNGGSGALGGAAFGYGQVEAAAPHVGIYVRHTSGDLVLYAHPANVSLPGFAAPYGASFDMHWW